MRSFFFRLFLFTLLTLLMMAGPLRGDALITTPPGTPNDWTDLATPFPLDIDDLYTREPVKDKPKEEQEKPDAPSSYVIPDEVIVERSIIFNLPPFDGNEAWMSDVGIECPWVHPDSVLGQDLKRTSSFFSFRLRSFFLRFFIASGEIPSDETTDQFVSIGTPGWLEASYTKWALTKEELINPYGSIPMGWREAKLREVLEAVLEQANPESPAANAPASKNAYEEQMFKILVDELATGYIYDMTLDFGIRTRTLGREIVPLLVRVVEECKNKLVRQNAVGYLTTVQNPENVIYMRGLAQDGDPVVANRAMMYLARLEDADSNEFFLQRAQDETKPWSSLAWYALGRIGKAESMPVLEAKIRETMKAIEKDNSFLLPAIIKRERLWTLMSALVRCSLRSGVNSDVFLEVAKEMRPQQAYQNRTILDLAGIGLAINKYGDKVPKSLEYFHRNFQDPNRFFSALTNVPDENPSYPFSPRTHYVLFEALQKHPDVFRGKKDTFDPIVVSLLNPYCDTALKYWALRHHKFENNEASAKLLKGLASDRKGNGIIRAAALYALFCMDREAATTLSIEVLEWFTPRMGQQMLLFPDQSNVAVTAMTILRVQKRLKDYMPFVREIASSRDTKPRVFELGNDLGSAGVVPYVGAFLPAPLIREAVRELGRTRNSDEVKTLSKIMNTSEHPAKAEAAQALGVIGGPEAVSVLLREIDNKDSWVRFCCDRALERIIGKSVECDFIFGSTKEIATGIHEWKDIASAWMKELKGK